MPLIPTVVERSRRRAFADDLLGLDCPLLLAKHEGCLMSTDEGFEDAVAALPHAEMATFDDPPAASPAFAQALRASARRTGAAAPAPPVAPEVARS